MSLIAIRNFSAPFTHRASLVALALVVLLFGILRISIGGDSQRPRPVSLGTGSIGTGSLGAGQLGSSERGGEVSPFRVSGFGGSSPAPAQANPEGGDRAASPGLVRGLLSPGSVSGSALESPAQARPSGSRTSTGGALAGSASASFFKQAPSVPSEAPSERFSDANVLEEILGKPAARSLDTHNHATADRPQGELDAIERRLGLR
jgi:hypothetical protein